MSNIDFNRLIKDIITSAKGEAANQLSNISAPEEYQKALITLKLEVTINNESPQLNGVPQKASRKLVVLTINES